MTPEPERVLVAEYERYADAERAVRALRRKGFAIDELAVLGGLPGVADVHRLCAFGGGLYELGLPAAIVHACEEVVRAGRFVVLAHGPAERMPRAARCMQRSAPRAWAVHSVEPTEAAAA